MFSKKSDNDTPLSAPKVKSTMGSNSSTFSVLGADMTIKGNIEASSELHIDGNVEGDIDCTSLVQGESSVIEGAIKADSARLAGRIEGSVNAKELVILKSAKIHGDVHYDSLTIEQGADIEGRFAHRTDASASKAKDAADPFQGRVAPSNGASSGNIKEPLILSK